VTLPRCLVERSGTGAMPEPPPLRVERRRDFAFPLDGRRRPNTGDASQEPDDENQRRRCNAEKDKRDPHSQTLSMSRKAYPAGEIPSSEFRETELRATVGTDPAIPNGVRFVLDSGVFGGLENLRICARTPVCSLGIQITFAERNGFRQRPSDS